MTREELIQLAIDAKEKAYVPYSQFHVGAAVEMEDGSVYTGANIENASLTPTICAERVAIFRAVHDGKRKVKRIVITGDAPHTAPCGVCRQVLAEFGQDAEIILADSPTSFEVYSFEEMLPHAFGPKDLVK